MTERRYEIRGKVYIQRPLVLGQIKQLLDIIGDVKVTEGSVAEVIRVLGDRLPSALAVILTEDGVNPRTKDISAVVEDMYYMPPETALEVIENFLELNPISAWFGRLAAIAEKITTQETQAT